jgi:hypothetical protein
VYRALTAPSTASRSPQERLETLSREAESLEREIARLGG